jgi:hypothetical protein
MSTQDSDVIKKVGSIGEKIRKLRRTQTAAGHKRRVRRHSKLAKKQDQTDENDPRTVIKKIYECYEKVFVISRELLSAFAFYNDFISDLQILILVSSFAQYQYVSGIMLFFMCVQYFLAVNAIKNYMEVCETEHLAEVFGGCFKQIAKKLHPTLKRQHAFRGTLTNQEEGEQETNGREHSNKVRRLFCRGYFFAVIMVPVLDLLMHLIEPMKTARDFLNLVISKIKNVKSLQKGDEEARGHWVLNDRTQSFMTQYGATREITEVFVGTFPSLIIQLYLQYFGEVTDSTQNEQINLFGFYISTLEYSIYSTILHMVWVILNAIGQAKYLGLHPCIYLKDTVNMGFGPLPIQAIMDDKPIENLVIPSTLKPVQAKLLVRALTHNQRQGEKNSTGEPSVGEITNWERIGREDTLLWFVTDIDNRTQPHEAIKKEYTKMLDHALTRARRWNGKVVREIIAQDEVRVKGLEFRKKDYSEEDKNLVAIAKGLRDALKYLQEKSKEEKEEKEENGIVEGLQSGLEDYADNGIPEVNFTTLVKKAKAISETDPIESRSTLFEAVAKKALESESEANADKNEDELHLSKLQLEWQNMKVEQVMEFVKISFGCNTKTCPICLDIHAHTEKTEKSAMKNSVLGWLCCCCFRKSRNCKVGPDNQTEEVKTLKAHDALEKHYTEILNIARKEKQYKFVEYFLSHNPLFQSLSWKDPRDIDDSEYTKLAKSIAAGIEKRKELNDQNRNNNLKRLELNWDKINDEQVLLKLIQTEHRSLREDYTFGSKAWKEELLYCLSTLTGIKVIGIVGKFLGKEKVIELGKNIKHSIASMVEMATSDKDVCVLKCAVTHYRKILEIAAKRNYGDVVKEILSRNYPEIKVLRWEEYQDLYDEGDKTIMAIAESIETLQNRETQQHLERVNINWESKNIKKEDGVLRLVKTKHKSIKHAYHQIIINACKKNFAKVVEEIVSQNHENINTLEWTKIKVVPIENRVIIPKGKTKYHRAQLGWGLEDEIQQKNQKLCDVENEEVNKIFIEPKTIIAIVNGIKRNKSNDIHLNEIDIDWYKIRDSIRPQEDEEISAEIALKELVEYDYTKTCVKKSYQSIATLALERNYSTLFFSLLQSLPGENTWGFVNQHLVANNSNSHVNNQSVEIINIQIGLSEDNSGSPESTKARHCDFYLLIEFKKSAKGKSFEKKMKDMKLCCFSISSSSKSSLLYEVRVQNETHHERVLNLPEIKRAKNVTVHGYSYLSYNMVKAISKLLEENLLTLEYLDLRWNFLQEEHLLLLLNVYVRVHHRALKNHLPEIEGIANKKGYERVKVILCVSWENLTYDIIHRLTELEILRKIDEFSQGKHKTTLEMSLKVRVLGWMVQVAEENNYLKVISAILMLKDEDLFRIELAKEESSENVDMIYAVAFGLKYNNNKLKELNLKGATLRHEHLSVLRLSGSSCTINMANECYKLDHESEDIREQYERIVLKKVANSFADVLHCGNKLWDGPITDPCDPRLRCTEILPLIVANKSEFEINDVVDVFEEDRNHHDKIRAKLTPETLLYTAVKWGKWKLVRTLLLHEGIDVNKKCGGRSPVWQASEGIENSEALKLIRETSTEFGRGSASYESNTKVLELLLADPKTNIFLDTKETNSEHNYSCLYQAAKFGHSDSILSLLRSFYKLKDTTYQGININQAARVGYKGTPLYIACRSGHNYAVQILLSQVYNPDIDPCDINKADKEGKTPLKTAKEMGRWDVVSTLLDDGRATEDPCKCNPGEKKCSTHTGLKFPGDFTIDFNAGYGTWQQASKTELSPLLVGQYVRYTDMSNTHIVGFVKKCNTLEAIKNDTSQWSWEHDNSHWNIPSFENFAIFTPLQPQYQVGEVSLVLIKCLDEMEMEIRDLETKKTKTTDDRELSELCSRIKLAKEKRLKKITKLKKKITNLPEFEDYEIFIPFRDEVGLDSSFIDKKKKEWSDCSMELSKVNKQIDQVLKKTSDIVKRERDRLLVKNQKTKENLSDRKRCIQKELYRWKERRVAILKNKRPKINLRLELLENYLLMTGEENQVEVAKEKLEYILSGRDGKLLSAAKKELAKLDRIYDGNRPRPPPATAPSSGTTDPNHQSFKCSSSVGFLVCCE